MGRYGGLILGSLIILVGVLLENPGIIIAGVATLAGGAIALSSAKTTSAQNAKANDLQLASASEGIPVPVVFGEAKVTGNWIRAERAQLRAEAIYAQQAGGGGSGGGEEGTPGITGYNYYFGAEYGLCMGPIDSVGQVFAAPGETPLIETNPVIATADVSQVITGSYTQPAIGADVDIDFQTTGWLTENTRIRIRYAGTYDVISIIDSTTATCRLVEREAAASGGYLTTITALPTGPRPRYINEGLGQVTHFYEPINTEFYIAIGYRTPSLSAGTKITIGTAEYEVLDDYGHHLKVKALNSVAKTRIVPETQVRMPVSAYNDIPDDPFGNSFLNLTLAGGSEGGTVRIYKGAGEQIRQSASDPYYSTGLRYPYQCWLQLLDYHIGTSSQPKTLQVIVRRLPRCIRDDGSEVTAIKTRGSDDPDHACYNQANPAAVIYEICTNKVWGRALSSGNFHEGSFADCSDYFAAHNIGMSFMLENPDALNTVLDTLMAHVKSILLFDGETVKLRTLLDTAETHTNIVTLGPNQIWDVSFQRGTWENTSNELRAEFLSRSRNYRTDSVIVHDIANFNTVGSINPRRITLNAFSEFDVVRQHASRLLREISYPSAQMRFKMNRFASQIQPGDIVRILWKEWSAGTVTSYYQIKDIRPIKDSDALDVTAAEDLDLSAVETQEDSVGAPTDTPWTLPVTGDGTTTGGTSTSTDAPVLPIIFFEPPPVLTQGRTAGVTVFGNRPGDRTLGITIAAAQDGATDYITLGNTGLFAALGSTDSDLAGNEGFNRDYDVAEPRGFTFTLANPTRDEATVLSCNILPLPSDNLMTLINLRQHFIVIDEEIIAVGLITKISTNSFRARNYIRGMFGTRIRAHAAGTPFAYSKIQPDVIDAGRLAKNHPTCFRGYPITGNGTVISGVDTQITHPDAPGMFLGTGIRPLAPEAFAVASAGLVTTAKVRPKFYNKGSAVSQFEDACNLLIGTLDGMTFQIETLDSGGVVLQARAPIAHTFTPDELADATKGIVTLAAFTRDVDTATMKIYSVHNGQVSIDAAEFAF